MRRAVFETLVAIGIEPDQAGKPLVGQLRGLWSARVGNYRVLYTIEDDGVMVRAVRHRAIAYGPRRR